MSENWFIAVSRQGKEYLAKRELENQKFVVYLPLYIAEWAKKPRIKPLLPSYLFVQIAQENGRWRSMLSTYGVRTVLCANDKPQAVAAWVVDEIQAREVDGLVQLPPRIRCGYRKGDSVRIKGSPLDAVFDEVLDHRRAAVFLSLLGRSQRQVVNLSRLALSPSQAAAVA